MRGQPESFGPLGSCAVVFVFVYVFVFVFASFLYCPNFGPAHRGRYVSDQLLHLHLGDCHLKDFDNDDDFGDDDGDQRGDDDFDGVHKCQGHQLFGCIHLLYICISPNLCKHIFPPTCLAKICVLNLSPSIVDPVAYSLKFLIFSF